MRQWPNSEMLAGDNDTSHLHVSLPIMHQGKMKWVNFAIRAGHKRGKPVMETETKINLDKRYGEEIRTTKSK